ncbi:MAG: hypothetical protein ABFD76_02700 [Smithella sp.]
MREKLESSINRSDLFPGDKATAVRGYLQRAYCFFGRWKVFDWLVIFICLASFGCSWIEAMVNYDSFHWGYLFGPVLDLKRGAVGHSEAFIGYGYVPVWISSVALSVFGERLMSIGMITGLFYSLTLILSYLVFLRFLKKSLAFISVLFIFLIHPYMIYPGGNYFAYTFLLAALIFFMRYPGNPYNGLGAGFFLCLSVLSRYSSVIAVLPPFIILLGWEFFTAQDSRKPLIKKIGLISAGFFVPLILFFIYLAANSALDDFFFQNQMMAQQWGRLDDANTYLNFLAFIFQIEKSSYAYDFRGRIFSLILLVCLWVIIRDIIRRVSHSPAPSEYATYDVVAVCLVTVFGFLNSLHVYETFRLVNGASIGVGVCVLVFYNFFLKAAKPFKYLLAILSLGIFLFLSSSLFFQLTSSAYFPWNKDVLLHKGVTNNTIGLFKGKLLTREYNNFYQSIYDAVAPFKGRCYILNYTNDGIALLINDLPRVQIVPNFHPWFEDLEKQARLIDRHETVILSYKRLDLPGYKEIFAENWPEEIPWLSGGCLFIYAPRQYTDDNRKSPVQNNDNTNI